MAQHTCGIFRVETTMATQLTLDALKVLTLGVRKYPARLHRPLRFKNYIFGLLFLRRFNDVLEQVSNLMADERLNQAEADADVCEDQGTLPPTARCGWLITLPRKFVKHWTGPSATSKQV